MNIDDRVRSSQKSSDPIGQVIQGIPVLGEDDQLVPCPFGIEHLAVFLEELREFLPFLVLAAAADF